MALQHLRSSTANKRPVPGNMSDGQLGINTNLASPGLFFKDTNGDLVKVGPVHVGTTAPNASPAAGGTAGNSVGEQWLDTTGGTYVFKVWDGSAWRSESGTFVDVNGDVMTGALGIIAGSAAAPGLYFSGDTNTGLYSPGADQLALSTNGTGRLFVDASGRVGVNTATPTTSLEIVGGKLQVSTGSALGVAGGEAINVFGATGSRIRFYDNQNSCSIGSLVSGLDSVLTFNVDGVAERMRLTPTGLGIGTSSASTRLHVRSSADDSTPIIRAQSNNQTQHVDLGFYYINYDNGAASSPLEFQIDGSTKMALSATGLGIGTTSPSAILDVKVASDAKLLVQDGNATGNVKFNAVNNAVSANVNLEISASNTQFFNGGSERARIDSSGRLLVGTSSLSTDLATIAIFEGYKGSPTSEGIIYISRGSAPGTNDDIGSIRFSANNHTLAAMVACNRDGGTWTAGSSQPTRLTFSVTADGAASPTEALRISSNRAITVSDGGNVVLGTTTGTKIGTSTSQKIGFFDETPIVQPTTGIAEAAFVENSGGTAVNVDSTFGGYTIQQVVQALQSLGLLA